MQNFYISKKSRRPFFEGNRQKVKGALFEVGTIVCVLWRKVFPEKRCPAQERFYFYFNIFLAPREVGASIILPVFGSAVVALTCMSNIYRKERQDHAMDLKTLAPWSEEFASRSGKFNRNIMGNAIIEQVMAPSTVQTSVLYKVNLNYGDMCLVKGWIWTNTVVKSANLL